MSQIDSFEQNTFASFASFSFEFLSTNRSDLNSFFASHDFGQLPKRAVGHCYGHSDISPPPIHQLSCLRMNTEPLGVDLGNWAKNGAKGP